MKGCGLLIHFILCTSLSKTSLPNIALNIKLPVLMPTVEAEEFSAVKHPEEIAFSDAELSSLFFIMISCWYKKRVKQ